MSLPLAFGTRVTNVPAHVPYLRVPPDFLLLWRTLLGRRKRPRVGIAWSGSQHIPHRSMPLRALAPLLRRQEYEFHSLQLEIPEADRDWLAAIPWLIDHSQEQKDFADAAALVAEMDLVLTIDTSLAHLAGALARPVWIMLPFTADCRWLLDRDETPWYPTARLFRSKRFGDWDGVVADVMKALG
jgi:ADP-heptose:LPS heptosyltransferase